MERRPLSLSDRTRPSWHWHMTLYRSHALGREDKGKGQSPKGDVSLILRAYADVEAFQFDPVTETPVPSIFPPLPRAWPWWERVPYINPVTVSGIGTDVSGIVAGTRTLADVQIEGIGSLVNKDAAQDANIASVTNNSGSLSVSVSPFSAWASTANATQTITTNTLTLSVNNGSGSETVVYTKVSGDDVTVDNPGGFSTSFSGAPGIMGKFAIYKATVTDGAASADVQFSVTLDYDNPNNNV